MSDKKWSCKWTGSGRRGRTHKGKEYPRHALKYFEGTHMGMRRRVWSKSSGIGAVWREGRAALSSKYIIGLLNKFVGKTYEEFKFVYDQKTKNLFKKYDLRWGNLEDYLHDAPKEAVWHDEFYVDDEGFIRKCKRSKKYHNRGVIKKRHIQFNSKVKLPYWGQLRTDPQDAVGRSSYTWSRIMPPQYRQPLLLGEFYVQIEHKMYKLPVYTCNQDIMITYKNYRAEEWDSKKRKYITIPFWMNTNWGYRGYSAKDRFRVANEWINVHVYGMPYSQSCYVRMKNLDYSKYENRLEHAQTELKKQTDPLERDRLEKEIEEYKDKLESTPMYATYDMGYGPYYTFVKKVDYERVKGETA